MTYRTFTYLYRFRLLLLLEFDLLIIQVPHTCECVYSALDGVLVDVKPFFRYQIMIEYAFHGPPCILLRLRNGPDQVATTRISDELLRVLVEVPEDPLLFFCRWLHYIVSQLFIGSVIKKFVVTPSMWPALLNDLVELRDPVEDDMNMQSASTSDFQPIDVFARDVVFLVLISQPAQELRRVLCDLLDRSALILPIGQCRVVVSFGEVGLDQMSDRLCPLILVLSFYVFGCSFLLRVPSFSFSSIVPGKLILIFVRGREVINV